MIQINFLNATVRDNGYGLEVNGKKLEEVISIALGTVKELPQTSFDSIRRTGVEFSSKLCNVSVTIDDRSEDISETIVISNHGGDEEVKLEEYLEEVACKYAEKSE